MFLSVVAMGYAPLASLGRNDKEKTNSVFANVFTPFSLWDSLHYATKVAPVGMTLKLHFSFLLVFFCTLLSYRPNERSECVEWISCPLLLLVHQKRCLRTFLFGFFQLSLFFIFSIYFALNISIQNFIPFRLPQHLTKWIVGVNADELRSSFARVRIDCLERLCLLLSARQQFDKRFAGAVAHRAKDSRLKIKGQTRNTPRHRRR